MESSPKSALVSLIRRPAAQAGFSLLLVLIIGAVFHADKTFFQWDTHRDMLRQVSVYGILACGMTIVIISGGIDLSVGSVMALSAVIFSLFSIHEGWSGPAAVLLTLVTGLACGMISGGVIARFNIQPFIATLAMMVFARGVAKLISGGQKISTSVQQPDGSYEYVGTPGSFEVLNARIFNGNLATVTLLLVISCFLCWLFLSRTLWGRRLFALGGNEEAAWFSGIPVGGSKILAYGLCGLFCAVAGICQAAQELQGDPEGGATYELTAIAMVVIGGTSLRGGQGTIGLTILGILIVGYLEKILSINAVGEETRLMLTGLIIVLATLFQSMKR